MRLVSFHNADSSTIIFVNPEHVVYVNDGPGNSTYVHVAGGDTIRVRGLTDDVAQALKEPSVGRR